MDRNEVLKQIQQLRNQFRKNPLLRLEFLSAVSQLLRSHGVKFKPALLSHVILAADAEILSTDKPAGPEIIIDP